MFFRDKKIYTCIKCMTFSLNKEKFKCCDICNMMLCIKCSYEGSPSSQIFERDNRLMCINCFISHRCRGTVRITNHRCLYCNNRIIEGYQEANVLCINCNRYTCERCYITEINCCISLLNEDIKHSVSNLV